MNPVIEQALTLAEAGFWVFRIQPNGRTPLAQGWQEEATRDPERIRSLFKPKMNIGIFTEKFMDTEALCVVDVDDKHGKHGSGRLLDLDLQGFEFPATREHATPSGGRHLLYRTPVAVRQGVDVLAVGLDIRSSGGYVVAPGSVVDGRCYSIDAPDYPALAPQWILDKCGAPRERKDVEAPLAGPVDDARAEARARVYLAQAEVACEGAGGDALTYRVAADVKDLGCSEAATILLMAELWNPRCQPPWDLEALAVKVANAYRYGLEPVGARAPEAVFTEVQPEVLDETPDATGVHPLDALNRQYAFVMAGGCGNVLWETTTPNGSYTHHLLDVASFKNLLANQRLDGHPIAKTWLEWTSRRTFDGIVFEPGRNAGPRWFNLWRGFSSQPAHTPEHPAVEMWKEHLLKNVCRGSHELAQWLTGWFAHLVQKPFEKPLVAVVFRGQKGTGKNALVERICHLLGNHALVTSRRRYLVSNFTAHLQRCLMFVLDEAFWSGDKEAEGVVKDLVTGTEHVIEPKGKEAYNVRNLTRVVVIGNEDWLVPASADERRWAVFDVGNGRQQDRAFFQAMREGLDEQGGGAHLLRYLMDFDLSTVDVNCAPDTQGLLDQKLSSLPPVEQWWFESLVDGQVLGSTFGDGDWENRIATNRAREAFQRWCRDRNIKARISDKAFTGTLLTICQSMVKKKTARGADGDTSYCYVNGGLIACRADWESYIRGAIDWGG